MLKKLLAILVLLTLVLGLVPIASMAQTLVFDVLSGYYSYEGSWAISPGVKGYNGSTTSYGYSAGAKAAIWQPELLTGGKYKLSVWNTVHSTNCPEMIVEVKDRYGVKEFKFPHNTGVPGMLELGEFEFNPGKDGYVKIKSSGTGFLRANCVKYELVEADMVQTFIFNVLSGYCSCEGSWAISPGVKGYNGSTTSFGYSAGAKAAIWQPELLAGGKYKLSVWNTVHSTNCPEMIVEVKDKSGVKEFKFPHNTGEPGMLDLGEFGFNPGKEGYVKLKSSGTGYLRANCVKYELVEADSPVPQPGEENYQGGYATREIAKKDVQIPEIKSDAAKIYVQSGANGDGSESSPFGTIKEAQDKVREIIAGGYPQSGIGVYVKGGTYTLEDSLTFTKADSGTAEAPVIWQAVQEDVTLTGGNVIDNNKFTVDTNEYDLKHLPLAAHGKVYVTNLSDSGISNVAEMTYSNQYILTFGDIAGTISRWPNEGYGRTGSIIDTCSRYDSGPRKKGFTYEILDPRTLRWADATSAWLYGYWLTPYDLVPTRIADINPDAMSFSGKNMSIYGAYGNARYYVQNLLEEVDAPGEWYLDFKENKLYVYPFEGWETQKISFSTKKFDVVKFDGASNIMIRDFKIEVAGGNGVTIGNGSSNCGVIGGEIINVSGVGAAIDGTNNFVRDCDISYTGYNGVNICGGDPKTLTKGGNALINCRIHDVGVSGNNRNGITFSGCGVTISHNQVYNTPMRGMSGTGLLQTIEYNTVERTNLEMADTGGIYFGDLGMGYGTVFKYNLVRDSVGLPAGPDWAQEGALGIYIDQVTGGVETFGNILINMKEPAIFNNGGRYNKHSNNLFINCDQPIVNIPWYNERTIGAVRENMSQYDFSSQPFKTMFPYLETTMDDELEFAKYVTISNNVSYKCGNYKFTDVEKHGGTLSNNIQFNSIPNCDLNTLYDFDYTEIKKQIPDFQELPIREMGIYTGGARKDTQTIVFNNSVEKFDLTYPANTAVNVNPNTTLKWIKGKGGIKSYSIYIAEDEKFKKIISNNSIIGGELPVNLDYGKTYYWRVKASPMLGYSDRWNSNGIFSFTTMPINERLESEIISAEDVLSNTSNVQYAAGAKEALQAAITAAKNSSGGKEDYNSLVKAKEDYLSKKIVSTNNLATYIYDDYQLDKVGQRALGLFMRSENLLDGMVQNDPLGDGDSKNLVVRFNDKEETYQHAQRYFASQSGYVQAGSKVMASQTNAAFSFSLMGTDTYVLSTGALRYVAAKVVFAPDGKIYADQKKQVEIMPYEANKWYDIKIVARIQEQKYDVYIDKFLKASDVPFDTAVKEIGLINYDTLDGTIETQTLKGQFFVDNLIVKAPASIGRNQYLMSLSINGNDVAGFEPGISMYEVDIPKADLKNARIEYISGKNANVKVHQEDNATYITVISADLFDAFTYILKGK